MEWRSKYQTNVFLWTQSKHYILTCIWDILNLEVRTFFTEKNGPKFSIDTLNDNVDNAKSFQWKCFILQFAAKKNFPQEYFLGQVQAPYFTWAELNTNEQNPLFSFICIRFGLCEVRRLNLALPADRGDVYLITGHKNL